MVSLPSTTWPALLWAVQVKWREVALSILPVRENSAWGSSRGSRSLYQEAMASRGGDIPPPYGGRCHPHLFGFRQKENQLLRRRPPAATAIGRGSGNHRARRPQGHVLIYSHLPLF